MKKLFILGIGGLVGSKLAVLARNKFSVFGTYNQRNPRFNFGEASQLNITDEDMLIKTLSRVKPEIIVNACALHNVDYCEKHREQAKKVNVEAVKNIFEFSKSLDCKLVQISSDSIFDGTKKLSYIEEDIPNPVNFYGYTKLESEKIVLENYNNLVVRASVLYGWLPKSLSSLSSSSMKPTNFAQWLINKLKTNEKVKIVIDEYSSPIIAEDFAKSILHLILGGYSGVFHSSPPLMINRYDFSIKLAKNLNLNSDLIQPVTNKEFGRLVDTGSNKCLDSNKIITKTKFRFLTLEESFKILKKQIMN